MNKITNLLFCITRVLAELRRYNIRIKTRHYVVLLYLHQNKTKRIAQLQNECVGGGLRNLHFILRQLLDSGYVESHRRYYMLTASGTELINKSFVIFDELQKK